MGNRIRTCAPCGRAFRALLLNHLDIPTRLNCQFPVSQVVSPCVFGSLYLWGHGHTTAEGEHIPVRMEALEFSYPQHLELLLPVVIEHTIDERSPLFGHTHESLQALGAEIVVTFEGCSESGDQFMARQSYLPDEVHWGFVFAPIIHRAARDSTRHTIDISRFHDIEPQRDLCMGPPGRLSSKVVAPPRGMVPYPHLTNNTLVLSDLLLLAPVDGKLCLHIRSATLFSQSSSCHCQSVG